MTASADDVAFRRHAVADRDVGHEASDLHHVARELVADGERRSASALCPRVPLVDVHVGAAHAGAPHLDQHFVVADLRTRDVPKDEAGTGGRFHQRSHRRLARCTE
jgi:hypothetical protein